MNIITSINPSTGEKIGEYERISLAEAKHKALLAHETFHSWRGTPLPSVPRCSINWQRS